MKVCEKYKLDLLDYATGEMTFLTKEKQQQLFAHLRKCTTCRKAFYDYGSIYALAVTEAHTQRPEFRKRMDDLLRQFRKEQIRRMPMIKPIRGEQFLNHEEDIGSPAGAVWHHLGPNGRVKENDLKRKVKLPTKIFDRAIGWLSCQNKIHRTRVKKTSFVYLTETERQIYQSQAQV